MIDNELNKYQIIKYLVDYIDNNESDGKLIKVKAFSKYEFNINYYDDDDVIKLFDLIYNAKSNNCKFEIITIEFDNLIAINISMYG